ncbi:MAG: hypothetical protein AB7O47_01330 [Flavobacteriales bacterium]
MLSPVKYILVFLLLISYGILGYLIQPGDIVNTAVLIGVVFGIYFYLIGFTHDKNEVSALLWFSIIFRLVFLFSVPMFSNDYIRFLFDGKLMLNGVNPYLYQPSEILSNQTQIDGSLFGEFFSELVTNHKYSLAFPLVQYAKVIPAYFIDINPLIGLVILRIPILIADFILFKFLVKLLDKLNLSYSGILIYALNPLVIIGLMANISFIGVMLCLFVVGLYYLIQNKWIHSLIFIAVSSVSSIFTILLLPLIFKKIGVVRSIAFIALILIMLLMFSVPFYQEGIFELLLENLKSNISSSPINFGLANVFDWLTGKSHIIIPALFLVALFSISISRANDWISVIKGMMFCVTSVVLLSFNIKPHYFILLVLFSSLIQEYHFAIIWSLIAFINYPIFTQRIELNYWIMPVEFSLLLVLFLLELFGKTKKLTE